MNADPAPTREGTARDARPGTIVAAPRGFADGDRFFRFSQVVVKAVLHASTSLVVEDLSRCPTKSDGPLILASSHVAYYDIPLLGSIMPRAPIFISKSEVERWPVLGWVGARYGTIYLRRGEADRGAIRDALGVLAAQQMLTIFPEGHRNKGNGLLPAQPGISLLASRGRALIWPVAIDGTHRIFKHVRPRVTVRGGEPFDPRAILGTDGSAVRDHQAIADEVMRRIAALLPREGRGAYA